MAGRSSSPEILEKLIFSNMLAKKSELPFGLALVNVCAFVIQKPPGDTLS